MALKGNTNEEKIWNYLMKRIGNPYGVAGLMGNLYAESGLRPNNLENLCETRLREAGKPYCTDELYTEAVDSGKISAEEFQHPLPNKQYGYGLAQWTSPGRKLGLYNLKKIRGVSIADLEMQLDFLVTELKESYSSVFKVLESTFSVLEASNEVLIKFEAPASKNELGTQNTRVAYGQKYYDRYVGKQSEENDMSVSAIIEKATSWMESIAKDNSHGYDQIYRWGEKGDYDCSAAVITAWQNAGVPVKTKGATYTGNMLSVFKKCGFQDVTASVNLSTGSGLKRGDVLLHTSHHTAMYCGNGNEVEASINEKGTATGGTPGDQTGREFLIRAYRNYPWTNILRYTGGETVAPDQPTENRTYVGKGVGTATAKTTMNIRTGAGTSYGILAEIGKGTNVEVLEVLSSGWYKIVWPGASCGYAFTSNTTGTYYSYKKKQAETAPVVNPVENVAVAPAQNFDKTLAGAYKTTADLNMRVDAGVKKANGKENKVILTIPQGKTVHNYGYYSLAPDGKKWLYVVYNGTVGFCSSSYLKK